MQTSLDARWEKDAHDQIHQGFSDSYANLMGGKENLKVTEILIQTHENFKQNIEEGIPSSSSQGKKLS
jgi:hypothetical protein